MITLPKSFEAAGFLSPDRARMGPGKFKGVMIGIDSPSDYGKSEFALSCPGPGLGIMLDRSFDGCLDNPHPPASRQSDWAFKVIKVPTATQSNDAKFYQTYWMEFYKEYLAALAMPEARSVLLDGDSDSWELQRLASFGKLTQVPPLMYTDVNAARRAMYNRAWDSRKIFIATNKVKGEYKDVFDAQGNPVMTAGGAPKREPTGEVERQGFADQDYLFQIQLRCLRKDPAKGKPYRYGIRIMKCKPNQELIGEELWDSDCNFQGLVSLVYPSVPMEVWGYRP